MNLSPRNCLIRYAMGFVCLLGYAMASAQNPARSFNASTDYLQSASSLTYGGATTVSVVFDMYKPSYTNADSDMISSQRFVFGDAGSFTIDPDCSSPTGQFCVSVNQSFGLLTCYFSRPSAGAWHHYAMAIFGGGSGGTCDIFVDGSPVSVSYASQSGTTTGFEDSKLNVGQQIDFGPARNFVGYLSRIALFTGSLDSTDAAAIAACGSPTDATSATLINYWPINQTSPELPTVGGINLNVSGTTDVTGPCAGAPSISASPSTVSTSTTNTITLTGVNTSWTSGTPGSPTFTVTNSGTSCSITAQTITGATSATLTFVCGSGGGTATINDPSTSTSTNVTVRAPQTWYIRADGGTRFSANVPSGQCDGQADVAYPGSGTNQHCAFNDFRYLWSDDSQHAKAWVISGGDTVIVRGCAALPGQSNPANPSCRLGADTSSDNSPWCGVFGSPNPDCTNPTIPAGSSGAHTRFLSTCAAAGNCAPGNETNPKLYHSNLTQLFGGFGLFVTLEFSNTQYVDFEGFELTTHNGVCSTLGTPLLGGGCSTSQPYSDYATYGIRTNNTTSHITFQDVYIHGFNASGLFGPIGGPVTMLRTFSGFNASAGWDFDDGSGTPDAAGSALAWTHTIWEGNGCQEEYPIVDTFPAVRCWSQSTNGFGDAISGQGGSGGSSVLDSFIADDYQALLNIKDGFIGPHVYPTILSITNSVSAFNGGQQWKWGGGNIAQTVTFENNLTIAGCNRMTAAMSPGPFGLTAPSGYNTYFADPCRANGDVLSSPIAAGSTWTVANNTFIDGVATLVNVSCPISFSPCPGATVNWFNNLILGYSNIPTPGNTGCCGTPPPAVFLNNDPSDITINADYSLEYNVRNGSSGSHVITSDPLLLNEPSQGVTAQSALDVFTLTQGTTSFTPTGSSPAIHAGTTGGPGSDYFGTDQTSPATIGAVVFFAGIVATPTFSPVAGTYVGTQNVAISTTTAGATICYTVDGSTPTTNGAGTCTHGTTYTTPFSVASSLTVKAVASKNGFLDSSVGSAAYVITTSPSSPVGTSGSINFTGCVRASGSPAGCS